MVMTREDAGLETLLLLHNEIYDQGNGCWIKIEAWRVEATEHVPHGIRYALTLHDRYGTRLLGFDNAHAVKPPKRMRYTGRRLAYDHRHRHSSDRHTVRIHQRTAVARRFLQRSRSRT